MKNIKVKLLKGIEKSVKKETGLNPEDWPTCSWLFYQPKRPSVDECQKNNNAIRKNNNDKSEEN